MSDAFSLGLGRVFRAIDSTPRTEHVILHRPLDRILAFTGRSIDDVVNSPMVTNQIYGYFKLQRWVTRESEISELERAWNPLGRRT
jgi:hypothetical protein